MDMYRCVATWLDLFIAHACDWLLGRSVRGVTRVSSVDDAQRKALSSRGGRKTRMSSAMANRRRAGAPTPSWAVTVETPAASNGLAKSAHCQTLSQKSSTPTFRNCVAIL